MTQHPIPPAPTVDEWPAVQAVARVVKTQLEVVCAGATGWATPDTEHNSTAIAFAMIMSAVDALALELAEDAPSG